MQRLIGRLIGAITFRTIAVLALAPVLQYFVNQAFSPDFLVRIFAAPFLTYGHAALIGGLIAVVSAI